MTNLKISSKIRKIDILIVIDLVLIALALMLVDYTNIDVQIQNHLFNFQTKTWVVDRNEPIEKLFFYKLPKVLLGVAIFLSFIASLIGFNKIPSKLNSRISSGDFFYKNRHKFFLFFLGLTLIPLVAGNVKKFTNIYCPCQVEIYDGNKPYVKIFENFPQNFHPEKKGKCFPAGHAVTGFTLLILFFIFEKKSRRIFGLFSGIIFGWVLGIYQMAKGVHFFSDTLVAMLLCFLIAAVIARFYEVRLAKTSN